LVGAFEKCLKLEAENGQTNPEGPARLTRRLIMDLVFMVIFVTQYSTILKEFSTSQGSKLLNIVRPLLVAQLSSLATQR